MVSIKENSAPNEIFTGVDHAEKYHPNNWIARQLIDNFMKNILAMVLSTGATDVHEIGCGEGHILGMLARRGLKVRGCDISQEALAVAREESAKLKLDFPLVQKSIYDLNPLIDSANTVLCCEVLEHLTEPELALRALISVTKSDLILSVPNEPIWHILNMVRGRYLTALGNTPGHYQHWSRNQFIKLVASHADIVSVKTPLPWTLVHCKPRKKSPI